MRSRSFLQDWLGARQHANACRLDTVYGAGSTSVPGGPAKDKRREKAGTEPKSVSFRCSMLVSGRLVTSHRNYQVQERVDMLAFRDPKPG